MSTPSNVRVQIIRWLSGEAQPGMVECTLIDRCGREWKFVDKDPIFSSAQLSATTDYPQPGVIRCEVVSRGFDDTGRPIAVIDTAHPDAVDAEDGTTRFEIFADQLVENHE